MNHKFFYFSLLIWSIFLWFINYVSPQFLWAKILFFVIIFAGFLSLTLIFSRNYFLSFLISFYITFIFLLQSFRQLSIINLGIAALLFGLIFFIFKK
jgi:hypothetical protein